MHVEVPEESQHQTNEHELKHKLGAAGQGVDEADQEQQRDADQHQAGQGRQKQEQRSQPQRNPRVRHGEVSGAALAADLGIAGIEPDGLFELGPHPLGQRIRAQE